MEPANWAKIDMVDYVEKEMKFQIEVDEVDRRLKEAKRKSSDAEIARYDDKDWNPLKSASLYWSQKNRDKEPNHPLSIAYENEHKIAYEREQLYHKYGKETPEEKLAEMNDKYVRLYAEFDNFRKRSAKERMELIQTAGKEVITDLLEVLDDCARAEKQLNAENKIESVKEGVMLGFTKLRKLLAAKGLKTMDNENKDFNPDIHEAITEIETPAEEQKGKVIDEIEKGYYLNDKIIRYAKVVVGK